MPDFRLAIRLLLGVASHHLHEGPASARGELAESDEQPALLRRFLCHGHDLDHVLEEPGHTLLQNVGQTAQRLDGRRPTTALEMCNEIRRQLELFREFFLRQTCVTTSILDPGPECSKGFLDCQLSLHNGLLNGT